MGATLATIEGLGRCNAVIGRIGVWIAASLIAIMTAVVILGVFHRYVLNDSLAWIEDISLIMMVTVAFLVAPFAYRSGANVAIELFIEMVPKPVARLVRILINMLILWIIYRYFFESLALVQRGYSIRINSVDLPWAYPYMIVPVAFAAMAAVGFELVLRDLWGLRTGSTRADLPHLAPQEPE